jgi:type 1 glutamine amidotransferase
MRIVKWLLALALLAGLGAGAGAADSAKPKRLLLVTHSGGFMHDSIGVAEQVLKEIGPKNGFEVTCWRFTADPDGKARIRQRVDGKDVVKEVDALPEYSKDYSRTTREGGKPGEEVTKAQCGRINASTLKNFDVVLFFTTGHPKGDKYDPPMTEEEEKDLAAWVKAGGAFAGTHCATDTLYTTPYGDLIGALFQTHPAQQKVHLKVEDPKHPAAKGLTTGMDYLDEWYIFRAQPYSRDKLHIITSIVPDESWKPNQPRTDSDYAISWCHEVGKGKVFYTSMGHRRETWRDPHFQESLIGGLKWALGQAPGDATPSSKLAGKEK